MENKISFKVNKNYFTAAKLYLLFGKSWLIRLYEILSIFGFLALVLLTVQIKVGLSLPVPLLIPKIFLFLGFLGFGLFQFIDGYLYQLENKEKIDKNNPSANIYNMFDFETAAYLGKIRPNNLDPAALFVDILGSRRISFVLNELAINKEPLTEIIQGFQGAANEVLYKVLCLAYDNAILEGESKISLGDIFWGFLKASTNLTKFLLTLELTEADVQNVIFWDDTLFNKMDQKILVSKKLANQHAGLASGWSYGYTLALDQHGIDITNPRFFGGFSVEGRENIIDQIENVLTKESKSSCLLTGPLGVGKSTLIYGLAEKIFFGNCLPTLANFRIVKFDVGSVLAAAQNPSDLENVLISTLNDAVTAGNVILFIDDIHTLFSGGTKSGTVDATEIIAPYLANGSVRVIGTTTENYFQTYIASKPSLLANFSKVNVDPTTENETIRILEDLSLHFTGTNHTRINYSAIKEVARLSQHFSGGKEAPARAVDLMDDLCTAAKNHKVSFLDKAAVDQLATTIMKVPIAEAKKDESEKLLKLEEMIHSRVIGQDQAVKAVADALRRARSGVTESPKPIGSFLFLGPTGVGKTELAKSLAWAYFGNEDAMIRMDMSEYQEVSSLDRFIGKKIEGTEQLEGGDFVKKVRENPFSVILLDELEKANPDILNLFLQVLDEGYFTDGMGQRVSFSDTIIIATSNAAANLIKEGVSKKTPGEDLKKEVMSYIQEKNIYHPEFLNRFDGIIIFNPLNQSDLLQVARLMFGGIQKDFAAKGYQITLEPGLLERLAQEGYQPELGARPMRRVFQDRLENFLAKEILSGNIKKEVTFTVRSMDIYAPAK